MEKTPGLDAAYGLQGIEDNLQLYADWARTYDSSFAKSMDYVLPMHVAQGFQTEGGAAPVLDLGAGTGLCGAALKALGIGPVDAADLSSEMLEVAGGKGIYRTLFTGNLLERLPVADGAYAGAVSSGTFTHGHVGPDALDEVCRVVSTGGVVSLSINAEHWTKAGYERKLDAMGSDIRDLKHREVPIYGANAKGAHAQDRSYIVTFRKA